MYSQPFGVFLKALALIITSFCFVAACTTPIMADDFYKGKQVKLYIGFGVGGSYDLYGRTIARYIGAHLPGSPIVVPISMPAAGSLAATNYIYNAAPRDGTALATVAGGAPTVPLMFPDQAKFDATKLTWIGSADDAINIDLVWHTSPVTSLEGLHTHEVVIGATGPGAATVDLPLLVNGILGLKYRLVLGYKTVADIDLAMERGEVEGESGTSLDTVKSRHPDWLRENKIHIIAQYGRKPLPDIPYVPLIFDQVKNANDWKALNLLLSRQEMAKPYVAPPELTAERTVMLRTAFLDTLKDPLFLTEADKLQMEIHPMSGEDVQALIAELWKTPPEIIERVSNLLNQKVNDQSK